LGTGFVGIRESSINFENRKKKLIKNKERKKERKRREKNIYSLKANLTH
jgi:hypothetical protein